MRTEPTMKTLTIDRCEEYIGYAEHCLKLAENSTDRELRVILREMAAEWLRLTEERERSVSSGGCVVRKAN
jgi:hypothetical protein